VAKTTANRLAADFFVGDLLVNLHLRFEHKVDLARVVEIRDLGFSKIWGACGFRWSSRWSSPLEG